MIAMMATDDRKKPSRIRLIIDTTEELRSAVQVRAYELCAERRTRVSPSDVLNEMIEQHIVGRKPAPRGRKPKPEGKS
jgi:hypothetical protein